MDFAIEVNIIGFSVPTLRDSPLLLADYGFLGY
jgi:hypothetical protein